MIKKRLSGGVAMAGQGNQGDLWNLALGRALQSQTVCAGSRTFSLTSLRILMSRHSFDNISSWSSAEIVDGRKFWGVLSTLRSLRSMAPYSPYGPPYGRSLIFAPTARIGRVGTDQVFQSPENEQMPEDPPHQTTVRIIGCVSANDVQNWKLSSDERMERWTIDSFKSVCRVSWWNIEDYAWVLETSWKERR